MDDGQVAVEDDDVVGNEPRLRQRGAAIVRHVDRHPLPSQPAGQRSRQVALILDDEHPDHLTPALSTLRLAQYALFCG